MKTISIIGNLTADCETNKTNDKTVINFSVAVNEKFVDKHGNKVNKVMFFKCAYWRKDESKIKVAEFLKKGTYVYVSGSPDINVYMNTATEAAGNIKINVECVNLLKSVKIEKEVVSEELIG